MPVSMRLRRCLLLCSFLVLGAALSALAGCGGSGGGGNNGGGETGQWDGSQWDQSLWGT